MPDPRDLLVAVVNDYPLVAAGLEALLRPYQPRIRVEAYVGELPPPGRADVVLFDTFGRPDAAERLAQLVAECGAPVLVYGWARTQEQIDDAARRGAAGFLPKTLDGEQVVAALEATVSGRPPRPSPSPVDSPMVEWPGQEEGLSAREAEVLSLIVAGLRNTEIAERCYLSINTVKTYVRTAYRKMDVSSRAQAVRWGYEHGFALESMVDQPPYPSA
jgi:DNA-binding NarL/FixJ family response regulator